MKCQTTLRPHKVKRLDISKMRVSSEIKARTSDRNQQNGT